MIILTLFYIVRLKEVQASDKSEMQALQKQVKDLQTGNTSLQNDRDRLSEALQVITVQTVLKKILKVNQRPFSWKSEKGFAPRKLLVAK